VNLFAKLMPICRLSQVQDLGENVQAMVALIQCNERFVSNFSLSKTP
jgi:hypothetical protein